jgi:uncharacterized membrane protein YfcA
MEIIGCFMAILIGVILGLIGGGGSILAVPTFVYLFKIDAQIATTYSLFVVGITALAGVIKNYEANNFNFKIASYFAFPSLISLLFVRKFLLPAIPNQFCFLENFIISKSILILVLFSILMILSAVSMLFNFGASTSNQKHPSVAKLSAIGFLVGIVVGFLGAGGGFLIVPALIFFSNLDFKQAINTSLLIISVNSLFGFINDSRDGVQIDFQFLFIFTTLSIVGMFVGLYLLKKIRIKFLKPVFGCLVLAMGCFILIKEIFF